MGHGGANAGPSPACTGLRGATVERARRESARGGARDARCRSVAQGASSAGGRRQADAECPLRVGRRPGQTCRPRRAICCNGRTRSGRPPSPEAGTRHDPGADARRGMSQGGACRRTGATARHVAAREVGRHWPAVGLASPRLASPRLASPHLTSPRLASPPVASRPVARTSARPHVRTSTRARPCPALPRHASPRGPAISACAALPPPALRAVRARARAGAARRSSR